MSIFQKNTDLGLAIIRIGIGICFMMHGWPKFVGGTQTWERVGGAMGVFGINFGHTFWGLAAASAEFFGGLFLTLGLLVQPSAFFLFITMLVAMSMHIHKGDGFRGFSHALEAGIVFLGIFFTGAGRFSLKGFLGKKE